ncbi:DUF4176 domain-containing protein [Bacillus sp. FJAT-42376]|uniref:DUF4176 domain-containing protein n=1 Tax=Bacillus sp. FJAT-42376 TaxID=2014076 RepID=UPI000F4FED49|nr:DUF4176 domain-containing protein [Bacillus sp. FJAT-42376]AZB41368.1 DUF4176 domain-containing protein [Bacillus sp. FJAT-42376]
MEKTDFNALELETGRELLPIGSVVEIGLVQQALMIYGRKQEQENNENKVWDYVACPYPQGHIGQDTNVFFNHSQIEKLVFKGLETKGETALRSKLERMFSGQK